MVRFVRWGRVIMKTPSLSREAEHLGEFTRDKEPATSAKTRGTCLAASCVKPRPAPRYEYCHNRRNGDNREVGRAKGERKTR